MKDLAQAHDSAIFVVIETRLGGGRAKAISDNLPFDGALHIETIGYAGGLWLMWNSDKVEVTQLANIKQEIHVVVKVRCFELSWVFSAVYASPRLAKRSILWDNLGKVVESHTLPWVIAGDFNEPLFADDGVGMSLLTELFCLRNVWTGVI